MNLQQAAAIEEVIISTYMQVVVANIQMRALKTEVEKGSMYTADHSQLHNTVIYVHTYVL